MNCERLHEQLDAYLAGVLPADTAAAVEAHLSACAECRSVVALMRGDEPPSIVQSVLASTTGRTCSRVQEELAAGNEEPFLRDHVAECAACDRFARALVRCDRILPELSEYTPDADFASDVVMSTVDRPSLTHVAWRRAADRCNRWIDRPGAARDLAVLVTAILVLLTSSPVAPFPELPGRALEALQETVTAPRRAAGAAWSSVGVAPALQRRGPRVIEELDRVGDGLARAGTGFLTGDADRVVEGATEVECGLQGLWLGLRSPDQRPGGPCARLPGGRA